MNFNQKGFTQFTLFLVGFTFVAVIWFFWTNYYNPQTQPQNLSQQQNQPQPTAETKNIPLSDTSTWQTYRNNRYGFEIKFPKLEDYSFRINNRDTNNSESNSRNIQFGYNSIGSANSRQIYIQELTSEIKEAIINNSNGSSFREIAGYGARIYLVPEGNLLGEYGDFAATLAIIFEKDERFFVRLSPNSGDSPEDFFIPILSTFKFVDSNKEINTTVNNNSADFTFPQVANFEDKTIEAKVNSELKKKKDSLCRCENQNDMSACLVDAKVTYDSNYIFSVSYFDSWYCKGLVHDIRGFNSLVFDMKTGEVIDFADIFGPPLSPLGPQTTDELANLIKKNLKSDKSSNQCLKLYDFEDIKNYSYSCFVSEKGIGFTPQLPYVGMVCTEDIFVPVSDVLPLAKPGSILERLPR